MSRHIYKDAIKLDEVGPVDKTMSRQIYKDAIKTRRGRPC